MVLDCFIGVQKFASYAQLMDVTVSGRASEHNHGWSTKVSPNKYLAKLTADLNVQTTWGKINPI